MTLFVPHFEPVTETSAPTLQPHQRLALAVIERTIQDLCSGASGHRADACRAVHDGSLLAWLDRLGVEEHTAQWALLRARRLAAGTGRPAGGVCP